MAQHRLLKDPKLGQRIADRVAEPMPKKYAAALEGVSETRLWEWLREGRLENAPKHLADFVKAMDAAEGIAATTLIERIAKAGKTEIVRDEETGEFICHIEGDWRANAWLAERMFPDQLGNRVKVDHAGAIATDVDVSFDKTAEDAARAFIAAATGHAPGNRGK